MRRGRRAPRARSPSRWPPTSRACCTSGSLTKPNSTARRRTSPCSWQRTARDSSPVSANCCCWPNGSRWLRATNAARWTLYTDLLASAMGPHGRRALHYRAGRWLERAGEPGEALGHYQRAFELAPGAGVAFVALERAARAARQLHVLVDAQRVLAADAGARRGTRPRRRPAQEAAALQLLLRSRRSRRERSKS